MKKLNLLLVIICCYISSQAQNFLGSHFSTRDAILSNNINPAAGIAGEMKWQANLIGFNTEVGNNYFFIKGKLKGIAKDFDKDKYVGQNLDGKRKDIDIQIIILDEKKKEEQKYPISEDNPKNNF